jgi:hypothetical protein
MSKQLTIKFTETVANKKVEKEIKVNRDLFLKYSKLARRFYDSENESVYVPSDQPNINEWSIQCINRFLERFHDQYDEIRNLTHKHGSYTLSQNKTEEQRRDNKDARVNFKNLVGVFRYCPICIKDFEKKTVGICPPQKIVHQNIPSIKSCSDCKIELCKKHVAPRLWQCEICRKVGCPECFRLLGRRNLECDDCEPYACKWICCKDELCVNFECFDINCKHTNCTLKNPHGFIPCKYLVCNDETCKENSHLGSRHEIFAPIFKRDEKGLYVRDEQGNMCPILDEKGNQKWGNAKESGHETHDHSNDPLYECDDCFLDRDYTKTIWQTQYFCDMHRDNFSETCTDGCKNELCAKHKFYDINSLNDPQNDSNPEEEKKMSIVWKIHEKVEALTKDINSFFDQELAWNPEKKFPTPEIRFDIEEETKRVSHEQFLLANDQRSSRKKKMAISKGEFKPEYDTEDGYQEFMDVYFPGMREMYHLVGTLCFMDVAFMIGKNRQFGLAPYISGPIQEKFIQMDKDAGIANKDHHLKLAPYREHLLTKREFMGMTLADQLALIKLNNWADTSLAENNQQ